MAKIWLTRNELKRLVREAVPSLSDDWAEQIPDKKATNLPSFKPPALAKRITTPSEPTPPASTTGIVTAPSNIKNQPAVVPGRDVRRSGWVGDKGKRDPTAKQAFTDAELKQGADVVQPGDAEAKGPGLLGRLKGMFGSSGGEKQSQTGFEEAPAHWSDQQKEKFHRDRAIGMRDRTKQYSKMFTDANRAGDEKKKAYAKKMHGFYSTAAAQHEKALKGAK